jgi:hypothetical protein
MGGIIMAKGKRKESQYYGLVEKYLRKKFGCFITDQKGRYRTPLMTEGPVFIECG